MRLETSVDSRLHATTVTNTMGATGLLSWDVVSIFLCIGLGWTLWASRNGLSGSGVLCRSRAQTDLNSMSLSRLVEDR